MMHGERQLMYVEMMESKIRRLEAEIDRLKVELEMANQVHVDMEAERKILKEQLHWTEAALEAVRVDLSQSCLLLKLRNDEIKEVTAALEAERATNADITSRWLAEVRAFDRRLQFTKDELEAERAKVAYLEKEYLICPECGCDIS